MISPEGTFEAKARQRKKLRIEIKMSQSLLCSFYIYVVGRAKAKAMGNFVSPSYSLGGEKYRKSYKKIKGALRV
jgi:hypothetical protein